jgi:hypothetical protein
MILKTVEVVLRGKGKMFFDNRSCEKEYGKANNREER